MSETLKLILASSSPRRQEILSLSHIPFETVSAEIDETFNPSLSVKENVMSLSRQKADAARIALPHHMAGCIVILGADTTVVCDSTPLGKPRDFDHGFAMLRMLQGRSHEVLTGFTILGPTTSLTEVATTVVEFCPMNDSEITRYLTVVKPYDKAGSYGIQDPLLSCFVRSIEGCYYNVVGLPLSRVCSALKQFTVQ
jgi:septum formation protein